MTHMLLVGKIKAGAFGLNKYSSKTLGRVEQKRKPIDTKLDTVGAILMKLDEFPPNEKFSDCGPSCQKSCDSIENTPPPHTSCPTDCDRGCFCNEGFI
ncbi:hypothetical protein AVEN_205671-1 [Araneus ventricosus]|uniref:TIL domain-containing protein n=1 Tax=Araneus ventricosus TaxID=182803 RepID=A0A4Y2VNW2_ARAVE|nr:hypothetical protein AVEN_205671-1 [Araneus ventricosus]